MNRTGDTTTNHQLGVGGIDDGMNIRLIRDITLHTFDSDIL
jgi:hypothetical protein